MKGTEFILESIEDAERLEKAYQIPLTDILLISLNIEGVNYEKLDSARLKFSIKPKNQEEKFFLAVTNNKNSRWKYENNKVSFEGNTIGNSDEISEDTCDTTYFRKYIKYNEKKIGTELTINSNSRSSCKGCKFCGTYNSASKDSGKNNLLNIKNLKTKLNEILENEKLNDFSHLEEVGIVTGCFKGEEETLEHLLMLNDVLRKEYSFAGELEYVGSQIRSEKIIETLAKYAKPATISLTIECFTRRDDILKSSKTISLEKSREILENSVKKGIGTSFIYIAGLDPLNILEEEFYKYQPLVTKMPIVNTLQEYVPGQFRIRDATANKIEYYLECRRIIENVFRNTNLKPHVWENYRGLFFTSFKGEKLDGIKI